MFLLEDLPTEIVWHVISHLDTARDLVYLSLVCKKLHRCVEKDGFRVFAKHIFSSIKIPAPVQYGHDLGNFWRDACWSVTTLSRNWDRKAFLAHRELPTQPVPQDWRNHRFYQTMGFSPVVDAFEEWYGGDWRDRHQIVACGAGPQLFVRVTDLGKDRQGRSQRERSRVEWSTRGRKGLKDGVDDITSVKLLPPYSSNEQKILIGRASGSIEGVTYDHKRRTLDFHQVAKTEVVIDSMSLNEDGLLAINHQGSQIATYDANTCHFVSDESRSFSTKKGSRARRMEFANRNKLIICGAHGIDRLVAYDIENNVARDIRTRNESPVYSLSILGDSSSKYGSSNLFLTGAYDGVVRLHDLRCHNTDVLHYEDRIDSAAVYSLASWGAQHFVAGGASHCLLKFFDIRLPGMKRYYATNLVHEQPYHGPQMRMRKGWNVFMSKDGSSSADRASNNQASVRERNSPVYSLSRPSEFSPTFFAGTESNLYQLDMVSIMDKHPDPIFGSVPDTGNKDENIKSMWENRYRKPVMRLSMYQHPETTSKYVQLMTQQPVGYYPPSLDGWDERWRANR